MAGSRFSRTAAVAVAAVVLAAGCAGQSVPTETVPPAEDEVTAVEPTGAEPGDCADVVDVKITPESSGTYRFDVTVRSPDTGWEKYADRWEVRAPDGALLGERVLAHPHVDEQPFTRSQTGIDIPADVKTVTVVARDSVAGFCGEEVEVDLP